MAGSTNDVAESGSVKVDRKLGIVVAGGPAPGINSVIGAATIRHAAMARFRGVAVEAGGVLVIDAPSVAAVADAAGMFVIGIEGP